ncbi:MULTISPECIES: hypothetical protein [Pseudoalteromonas]|uniref:type IVB secretion system protein IcmW n=1 Tax=Pseudoalteromonas TaxID=53246 RepID=UPI001581D9EB|nr:MULTISPECIES: hypothetical protein [Pseudoalteromonas]MDI4652578.1 hypothetical protein [Pseudoalteromonas shioyasakiensis]NUJ38714.1 hypothetical protein [Pseudoalteromonas sp. 0303]
MDIPIDIALDKVAAFASEIPGISLIFSDMEKVERWVAKSGEDKGFTAQLRQKLYELNESDLREISTKTQPLLWLLFFLPTSTSFYLLFSLNEIAPEISDNLLNESLAILDGEDNSDKRHAQVFVDRCTHLNAANFMTHITDEKFVKSLNLAIAQVKKEHGDVV